MSSDVLKPFGRFFLLDHLASGGMAEIFRASQTSKQGAQRILVIKRIQKDYASNRDFIQMFQSEIKVTIGFNHPNIVQLYDFGEENKQPYLSMEWVDGRNLRQILVRLAERKLQLPIDIALHVIKQAAAGLHYAHTFRDRVSGQPLQVVHRDISPQNLLISFDGQVKVIDFGIAKATTNIENTRAGVIKGKPSYLSPEQISGERLDGRCDQFALGAVFWELLTGRKLFAADTDLGVLKQIEGVQTHLRPPSLLNPAVPPELDAIVLKALSKSPDRRYASCGDLYKAISKLLNRQFPDFSPEEWIHPIRELFKEEITEDRKRMIRLKQEADQWFSSEQGKAQSLDPTHSISLLGPEDRINGSGALLEMSDKAEALPAIDATPVNIPEPKKPEIRALPKRTETLVPGVTGRGKNETNISRVRTAPVKASPWKGVFFFFSFMGLLGGLSQVEWSSIPIPDFFSNKGATLFLDGQAESVKVTLNGVEVASRLPATVRSVPAQAELQIESKDIHFRESLNLQPGELKTILVPTQTTAQDTFATGYQVTLKISPQSPQMRVQMQGKAIQGPPFLMQALLDTPMLLSIQHPLFKSFQRNLFFRADQVGDKRTIPLDVTMEALNPGFLTLRSTPSADVTLTLGSLSWTKKTPFESFPLPAGQYQIKLENSLLGMGATTSTVIYSNRNTSLDEHLTLKKSR